MKGITPVIAVILLMLITISMVGFAFVWFSRVTTTTGEKIEEQTMNTISSTAKRIKIDSISPSSVAVRNIGTVSIDLNQIAVFVDGNLRTNCGWSGYLAPGSVASCSLSPNCLPAQIVKVTSPGNSDEAFC